MYDRYFRFGSSVRATKSQIVATNIQIILFSSTLLQTNVSLLQSFPIKIASGAFPGLLLRSIYPYPEHIWPCQQDSKNCHFWLQLKDLRVRNREWSIHISFRMSLSNRELWWMSLSKRVLWWNEPFQRRTVMKFWVSSFRQRKSSSLCPSRRLGRGETGELATK